MERDKPRSNMWLLAMICWTIVVYVLGSQPPLYPRYENLLRRAFTRITGRQSTAPAAPVQVPAPAQAAQSAPAKPEVAVPSQPATAPPAQASPAPQASGSIKSVFKSVFFNEGLVEAFGHFAIYGTLGALLFLGFHELPLWNRYGVSLLYASTLGVVDETHQLVVPGRTCSFFDLFTDIAGFNAGFWATLAILAFFWNLRSSRTSKSREQPIA